MAAGSWTKMSSSQNGVVNSLKDCSIVTGHLEFTSTDVTIEADVSPLTTILGMSFARVGAVNQDDAGYLSLSETYTSGKIAVDADQEVTIVRQPVTSGGTLTSEEFVVTFYGLDL